MFLLLAVLNTLRAWFTVNRESLNQKLQSVNRGFPHRGFPLVGASRSPSESICERIVVSAQVRDVDRTTRESRNVERCESRPRLVFVRVAAHTHGEGDVLRCAPHVQTRLLDAPCDGRPALPYWGPSDRQNSNRNNIDVENKHSVHKIQRTDPNSFSEVTDLVLAQKQFKERPFLFLHRTNARRKPLRNAAHLAKRFIFRVIPLAAKKSLLL